MPVTLLVENNPKIEKFYSLNLLTWLNIQSYWCQSSTETIEILLSKTFDVNLLLVRASIDQESTAQVIIEFLKEKKLNIPVIVIGTSEMVEGSFTQIKNSLNLRAIIKSSGKALGITANDMASLDMPDFYPIPIHFFKHIKETICEIYAQNPLNSEEFNLQFLENSLVDQNLINQFILEGEKYLFIEKLKRLEFVNYLSSEYMALIELSQLNPDEKITVTENNFILLSKKLLSFGLTGETIALANRNLTQIRNYAKSNNRLSQLLELMLNNKTGYLFKHTQILTFISLHLIRNIDWGSPSQEESISFISFFHDIFLQTDEEAKISSQDELKNAQLSPKDKQRVERHAQLAAELLSQFPHTPMGADQIIRQHHGSLNGIGFSEHFSGNLSPASIVLIVAEEVTKIILRQEAPHLDSSKIISEVREKLPNARLQKIINLLESLTI